MAVLARSHGGSCCGATHIYSFNEGVRGQTQGRTPANELIALLVNPNSYAGANYKLNEVILSDLQTREMPVLLFELARLGFVYTSSWMGAHNTPVHRWERAATRKRLSEAHFFGRWTNELNGMVSGPGLGGPLPRLNEGQRAGRLQAGMRVRVNSPNSRRHNRVFEILSFTTRMDGMQFANMQGADGAQFSIVTNNLIPVDANNNPINEQNEQQGPVYRHLRNEPVADNARRRVLSEFHARFRESGNLSRPFDTIQEARAAYPRAQQFVNRIIYADGSAEVNNVN